MNHVPLIEKADRLRDAGKPAAAAETYAEILKLAPWLTGIRVQYGNMLKDCGRLAEAEAAYREALTETPDDADLHLQLGHVLKLVGRRTAALAAYRQALALDPLSAGALHELREAGDPAGLEAAFAAQGSGTSGAGLLALAAEVAALRERLDLLAAQLPDLRSAAAFPIAAYDSFRALWEVPPAAAAEASFLIVIAAEREAPATLYEQLAALRALAHPGWRVVLFGSTTERRDIVARAAAADPRIAWVEPDGDTAAATTELRIAEASDADWIVLLGAGAVPHRHALGWIAAAHRLGDAAAFVFDAENVDFAGGTARRGNPVLRQAVDYDTLLQANIYGEAIAVRRAALLRCAARLCTASPEAARLSLLLELCRDDRVGHIPFPLVASVTGPETGDPASQHAAIAHHLRQHGLTERVAVPAATALPLRLRWRPAQPAAAITVIIPTRDNADEVRECTASLLATAAQPEHVAILVLDNGSAAAAAAALAGLERPGLRVMRVDEPFNWSRLNNLGVAESTAPLIVFANDDMRMLSRGWDDTLRGLLERKEVGAVGVRLLYPDDTVQHAGMLFGWRGALIHDGLGEPAAAPGPTRRWQLTRAVGSVTGAFLATRHDDFTALGGFDEAALPVGFSDVDYALKLRRAEMRVLWTPQITLYHHESKTRGLDHLDPARLARDAAERRVMAQRWGDAMTRDPGVHPLWHDATMPFRLIAPASAARIAEHIRLCASPDPWRVE